jgi:hypothetical protein
MRSRWMLVISGVRRLRHRRVETVVIEHDHEHADDAAHGHTHAHAHVLAGGPSHDVHRHVHRHVAPVPDDPFTTYGRPTAFFIGMLHGVGAETPTQVVIFLTAAGVGGTGAGMALLLVFLAGLLSANTVVALAGTFGFLGSTKNWPVYVCVSILTAVSSLVIGSLFLFGHGDFLPAIFTG